MPAESENRVLVDDVNVTFAGPSSSETRLALSHVDLAVRDREFICLLGPSGCGKTTLLNTIAGFVKPTTGRVVVDGRVVENPSPDCGMVFQEYALFPWYTVQRNVEFGPRMRRWSNERIEEMSRRYIQLVSSVRVRKLLSLGTIGRHEATSWFSSGR